MLLCIVWDAMVDHINVKKKKTVSSSTSRWRNTKVALVSTITRISDIVGFYSRLSMSMFSVQPCQQKASQQIWKTDCKLKTRKCKKNGGIWETRTVPTPLPPKKSEIQTKNANQSFFSTQDLGPLIEVLVIRQSSRR